MNKKSTLDIEALGANQNVVSRAYWKSRLSSFTFNSYFTSAAKSTQSQDSNKKNATFEASAETFELLDQFAKSPKAKHLILLSTLGLLANRCSGLNDIGVVTPNYLEDKEANNLLIRLNDFTGLNLPEWLTALKVSYFEDLGHGDYPISKVLEDSNSDFILGVRMDGVNHSFSEGGLLPTMIFSFEADNNLKLTIDYDEKYFDASIIAVLAKGFYNLLSNIIQNKEEIVGKAEMIGGLEKELLLQQFDRSLIEYPSNETLHGLFEKQVLINPDKTAVIFKNHNLSYGELNDRSNQLAKVLNHKGVERDTIVGLLTDRSIDTVIGMLAILKAGGAYLPIDVDYPEERKEYIIKDSGIKLLLTSSEVAEQNKYDLVTVTFDEAQDLDSDFNELANINEAGDLCYVLYTSGTTGNPKGVMVEHRNVVRLFFNEECQFDFNADDVWTMFHSHCFDFSVWEMYGALLFGGKLVIVPKIEAKDTQAFYNIIKEQGVTVLNQTPTAFSNFINKSLDDESQLSLRYVIFGGEALNPTSLKDWKIKNTAAKLVNMYGITETTVHVTYKEIGEREMNEGVSNIGNPIPTLATYVLDSDMNLLPVGIAGELYIGGSGVTRGYLNNPELTAQRFVKSPFKKGDVLYRSGDIVRINQSGDLVYLNRADSQVQLRGFRIELGEIENQLMTYEGIEEVTVDIRSNEDDKYLAAYYVGKPSINAGALREFLLSKVPDYMVPSYFMFLEKMPLTSNGKLDKKGLPNPDVISLENYVIPKTVKEKLLAKVWSEVLGMDKVGTADNFFSIGGDSIKSIQISSRMRNLGYEVSVKDILTHQTIASLAKSLKEIKEISDQSLVEGAVPLTPIQKELFEGALKNKNYFNQSTLLNFEEGISADIVKNVFAKLQEHHDALRMTFKEENGQLIQLNRGLDMPVSIEEFDLSDQQEANSLLTAEASKIQASIDISNGPLMKLGLFHMEKGSRLLLVIHHLVIDGISWRILFEDIETLFNQVKSATPLKLPLKTHSYQKWSKGLIAYRQTEGYQKAEKYWLDLENEKQLELPLDYPKGKIGTAAESQTRSFSLSEKYTKNLLTKVNKRFNTQINDILLAGLMLGLNKKFGLENLAVDLEGHGREDIGSSIDVSRTVGWFTSIYPAFLSMGEELSNTIKTIKESLRNVPNNGLDYLLLKQHNEGSSSFNKSQISFNYLGQFDADTSGKSYDLSEESIGEDFSAEENKDYTWDISGIISGGQLSMSIRYSTQQYKVETINSILDAYQEALEQIIDYCSSTDKTELTPSDLTYKKISIPQLDTLQTDYKIADIYPLSPMQEGMLFHSLLDADADHYFEQLSCRWNGEIDMAAIRNSMQELMSRYDILRTVFAHKGYKRPLQIVFEDREPVCQYMDVREVCKESSTQAVIEKYQLEDRSQKFNLSEDVLMRLTVLHIADNEYELIWSHHHVLMDGWCMSIIFNDFHAIYANQRGANISLPPVQSYGKYIEWLENIDQRQSEEYWKDYLQSYDNMATLPKQTPSKLEMNRFDQGIKQHETDVVMTGKLNEFARQEGVTLNTLIQMAWGILLSKYNRIDDVVFGSVVSGRPSAVEGVESMVGLFINTVPVRVTIDDNDTPVALLKRLQAQSIESEAHHYHPLSKINALSEQGKDLFDHIVIFENYPVSEQIEKDSQEKSEYQIGEVEFFEQTNYDLTLMVVPGQTVQFKLMYNKLMFDGATVNRIGDHLMQILNQLMVQKDVPVRSLKFLSEDEENHILIEFNNTDTTYAEEETIVSLFAKQVEKTPNNTALLYGKDRMTYDELDKRSNQIANYLTNLGVGKEDLVGLMIGRELDTIPLIYGILKAGGGYVPLDPASPQSRNQGIIKDAAIGFLITHGGNINESVNAKVIDLDTAEEQINSCADSAVDISIEPGNLAYVIHTSGSTGKPKGVVIEHGAVVNRLMWMQDKYPIKSNDVLLQKTPLVFDVSIWELFWWSFNGAALALLPQGDEKDPKAIMSAVSSYGVTAIHFVPSMLSTFLMTLEKGNYYTQLATLRKVFTSGEALKIDHVRKFNRTLLSNCLCRLINLYGPTEATVDVSYYECDFTEVNVPIGKPISNTRLYVIDEDHNLLPIGVPGELAIAGANLARGYLNNPTMTVQKFVESKMLGERIYKTGDLAKWMPDGNIEYLGRIDDQIKLRGYRIELGEIEKAVSNYPAIKETVAVAKENYDQKYLCVYFTSSESITDEELKRHLGTILPEYMIPTYYVALDELPLTNNGKVDRKSLPDPEFTNTIDYIAPSGEIETKLVEIWNEVLNIPIENISVMNGFFEVGGHSLNAVMILNKIFDYFNIELPLKTIYQMTNIRDLASLLESLEPTGQEEQEVEYEEYVF